MGLEVLTPWRVIGVGSVAIWPGIAPTPVASRWEVTPPALPMEHFLNPGKRAHREDEVGKSSLGASTSCMTMRVTLAPSMMQVSCMCLWILDRLLLSLLKKKL